MTKEEFMALGIQTNDVVLINGDFVGFVRLGEWENLFQTCTIMGSIPLHWEWKEIESIKIIGRVEEEVCGKKICHYCKNPLRDYVSRAEALENVAMGKWKFAKYHDPDWFDNFHAICYMNCQKGVISLTGSIKEALSDNYSDARWYNPDEGEK